MSEKTEYIGRDITGIKLVAYEFYSFMVKSFVEKEVIRQYFISTNLFFVHVYCLFTYSNNPRRSTNIFTPTTEHDGSQTENEKLRMRGSFLSREIALQNLHVGVPRQQNPKKWTGPAFGGEVERLSINLHFAHFRIASATNYSSSKTTTIEQQHNKRHEGNNKNTTTTTTRQTTKTNPHNNPERTTNQQQIVTIVIIKNQPKQENQNKQTKVQ